MTRARLAFVLAFVLSTLAVLPFLLTATLWALSYVADRGLNLCWQRAQVSFSSSDGAAALILLETKGPDSFFWSVTRFPLRPGMWKVPAPLRLWHRLGFRYFETPSAFGTTRLRAYAAPYWSLLLLASPPPVFFSIRHIRRLVRVRRGLCVRCGYDLRASKWRCPECGDLFVTLD